MHTSYTKLSKNIVLTWLVMLLFIWLCEVSKAWLNRDSRLLSSQGVWLFTNGLLLLLLLLWRELTEAGDGEKRFIEGGRGVTGVRGLWCCSELRLRFGGGGDSGLSFVSTCVSLLGGQGSEFVFWKIWKKYI